MTKEPRALIRLALVTLVVGSLPAEADEGFTGNMFLRWCQEPRGSMHRGFCDGYALGVAGGLRFAGEFQRGDEHTCVPIEAPASQMVEVGVQYISRNMKNAHRPASFLLVLAYREAWPCKP
jgi:hypothetical protein